MAVTAIILNYSRPDYVKKRSIPYLKNLVNEIIISHGKKEVYFEEEGIVSLDHSDENEEYGLTLRFLSGLEAKNEYVLIMDDDILPSEECIKVLLHKIRQEPKRLYGIYGRDIRNGYSTTNSFGEVPIVLTRCLITTREMCDYFMTNFRKYENSLIKNSKPYWNGEDILFSLLSIEKYGNLPVSLDLSHTNSWENYLDFSNSISLSSTHSEYRKKITKDFVEKLDLGGKIKKETNVKFTKYEIPYFVKNSNLIYPAVILLLIIFYYFGKKYLYRYIKWTA